MLITPIIRIPTFRYTHARYHDRMGVIDDLIGSALKKLEEDDLLDDTFVFISVIMVVSYRVVKDMHMNQEHVPLVVRIPKNFSHLVDHEEGTRTDGFVSFIDFGATILNLAGLEIPDFIDGKPFLKGVKLRT